MVAWCGQAPAVRQPWGWTPIGAHRICGGSSVFAIDQEDLPTHQHLLANVDAVILSTENALVM